MAPTSTTEALDISGYVRRVRRLGDLSQRDLAKALGVSQAAITRVENGGDIRVRAFSRILEAAGLRLVIVDEAGDEVTPMPVDVFRDRAGRRHPAHLDVHARPETPTMKMLFRSVDPIPSSGSWYHKRPERDRLRGDSRRGAHDEQLTTSAARARAAPRRCASGALAHRFAPRR
ncbi:XRE family transcriptional regulator [Microbacterium protaetiae]|uniref:XRE family transcriptional regulator n=1 Tax=Microbacterium protaetiae TaxID=2509458 RepID=A0A4P6EM01_9MICO|nr:helix-turn-helix transcriptional regulator [Microbacterium protaetiae]QAY61257.1 XRE family transcriptional regulator [Microbacterium protaetiae]